MAFSFLEDLGESIIDVGSTVALSKYKDKPAEDKPAPTVAAPAAYEKTQKPIAVNDNGAPVQTAAPQKINNNTMLLIGGGVFLLLTVVLLATRK